MKSWKYVLKIQNHNQTNFVLKELHYSCIYDDIVKKIILKIILNVLTDFKNNGLYQFVLDINNSFI